MVCVVAPVDQEYPADAGAWSTTLPPAQKVVGPSAVTDGLAGKALTVTLVVALAVQVFALVTVTV